MAKGTTENKSTLSDTDLDGIDPALLAGLDLDVLNEEAAPMEGDIFDSDAINARSKEWASGDFNTKLELEKAYQLRGDRPFIIWRKPENRPTPQNPHSKMVEKPFVQHLDHSHSTMDVIMRYYAEGMRIAFHHIPVAQDAAREVLLTPIRNYCNSREIEMAAVRREVLAELGITKKIQVERMKRLAAQAAKSETQNKGGSNDGQGSVPQQ